MRILRYYVSADAPARKWAVKAVILGEDGKEREGQWPTYFPSKRDAKAEADRRNGQLSRGAIIEIKFKGGD